MDGRQTKKRKKQPDILLEEYRAVVDEFDQAFRKILKDQKEEHIHKMRVSIKKLRALWKTLGNITDLPVGSLRSQVRGIFSTAGKVRELQVSRVIVSSYKLQFLSAFLDLLIEKEKKQLRELTKVMRGTDRDRLRTDQERILEALPGLHKDEVRMNLSEAVSGEYRKVINRLRAPKDEMDLHAIRKRIRNIDTQLELFVKLQPSAEAERIRQRLRPYLDLLGSWHDNLILLAMLERYIDERCDKNDESPLSTFRTGLKNRLELDAFKIGNSLESIRDDYEAFKRCTTGR